MRNMDTVKNHLPWRGNNLQKQVSKLSDFFFDLNQKENTRKTTNEIYISLFLYMYLSQSISIYLSLLFSYQSTTVCSYLSKLTLQYFALKN